jgi:hypothetical protein
MTMTGAHLHLLVNHAPILGAFFAAALLLASFAWSPDTLRRTAFVVLVGVGIAAVIADKTGEPAEDAIRGMPGVKRDVIHEHEELGEKSFLVAGATGLIALVMLVRTRRSPVPASHGAIALVLSLVVSGMMGYTGLLGGRIRHTEVRPGATPADAIVIEPPRQRPGAATAPPQ